MTLDEAMALAHGIRQDAESAGLSVAVAVCDELGRLCAFMKMDGIDDVMAGHEAVRRAIRAATTGRPSDDDSAPVVQKTAVESEGIGGSSAPGGQPIFHADELYGAVGVAGTVPEDCVRFAKAAIARRTKGRDAG